MFDLRVAILFEGFANGKYGIDKLLSKLLSTTTMKAKIHPVKY